MTNTDKVTQFTLRQPFGSGSREGLELHRPDCRHLGRAYAQMMGEKRIRFEDGVSGIEIVQEMFDDIRWMDGNAAYDPSGEHAIKVMSCCRMKVKEQRDINNAPVADDFNPNTDYNSGEQWDKSVFDFDALTDAEKAEWRKDCYTDPRTGKAIVGHDWNGHGNS